MTHISYPDIKTKIGNISLDNPFINASGCACYSENDLLNLINSESGFYITKTITLNHRDGNDGPRYYHNTELSLNSMGLPNLGLNEYLKFKNNIKDKLQKMNTNIYDINNNKYNKPLFFSVGTMSNNETLEILSKLELELDGLSGIEFNISCPNIEGKGQLGYDFDALDSFLKLISETYLFNISRNNLAIGLKMSPYFDNYQFNIVADIIKKYPRLDFLTCINGLGNGLIINREYETTYIRPNLGCGGIGGSVVKPSGLANVYKFKKLLNDKIDIIGCGGVSNGSDAFDYILAGASAVSIGTELVRKGTKIFGNIKKELEDIMIDKKYTSLGEFKNNLKII